MNKPKSHKGSPKPSSRNSDKKKVTFGRKNSVRRVAANEARGSTVFRISKLHDSMTEDEESSSPDNSPQDSDEETSSDYSGWDSVGSVEDNYSRVSRTSDRSVRPSSNELIIDSGSVTHLVMDSNHLIEIYRNSKTPSFKCANGTTLATRAVGKVHELMDRVAVAPSMKENIFSTQKAQKEGLNIWFWAHDQRPAGVDPSVGGIIYDKHGRVRQVFDNESKALITGFDCFKNTVKLQPPRFEYGQEILSLYPTSEGLDTEDDASTSLNYTDSDPHYFHGSTSVNTVHGMHKKTTVPEMVRFFH